MVHLLVSVFLSPHADSIRYCHNSHIRQFREAGHAHPHPPGGYEPQEDTSYEAYTLGQAVSEPKRPKKPVLSSHTAVDRALDPPVSFGLGASSRYLVQRWSDGTPCDKTGRSRQVEVQVHCSMTTSDVIYMVKEMALCQYVLIVHSPHLCSLPGFKAEQADVEEAGIRCREVVSDEDWEQWRQGGAERLRLPYPSRPPVEQVEQEVQEMQDDDVEDIPLRDVLQRALEAIGNKHEDGEGEKDDVVLLSWEEGEDGAMLVDADVLVSGDETNKMGEEEKQMILKVVREYLEKKERDKEERPRDEL